MKKLLVLALVGILLALGLSAKALADSPGTLTIVNGLLTYTGKALFVENSALYDATSGNWTFETDSHNTSRNVLDHDDGMVLRNVNVTDGNHSLLCFESVSTAGGRFVGACWMATYLQHDGVESDHPTRMDLYLAKPGHIGGWIRQIATFMWDDLQGGVSMALGIEPIRQGFGMPPELPLYWALNGERLTAWKPARDGSGNGEWRFNTLQIGDNGNLGKPYTIAAPSVGIEFDNIAGNHLVLEGGNSRGAGNGGSVCFAVAAAGGPGFHKPECVIEVAGLNTPVMRPIGNGITPLGDAAHGWGSLYIGPGGDIYRVGDAKGLYAQLQAALERIRILEAKIHTQSTTAP